MHTERGIERPFASTREATHEATREVAPDSKANCVSELLERVTYLRELMDGIARKADGIAGELHGPESAVSGKTGPGPTPATPGYLRELAGELDAMFTTTHRIDRALSVIRHGHLNY